MAKRTRPVKPLNEPLGINVKQDSKGLPVAVALGGGIPLKMHDAGGNRSSRPRVHAPGPPETWTAVERVEDMYEVDELWWRGKEQEIQRLYFDLVLQDSKKTTVYHDLVRDRWFRQAD